MGLSTSSCNSAASTQERSVTPEHDLMGVITESHTKKRLQGTTLQTPEALISSAGMHANMTDTLPGPQQYVQQWPFGLSFKFYRSWAVVLHSLGGGVQLLPQLHPLQSACADLNGELPCVLPTCRHAAAAAIFVLAVFRLGSKYVSDTYFGA